MLFSAVCTRVLPDEAAHSQYEMRSFVRSESGVLYPTGQGRLAEASNPLMSNTVADLTSSLTVAGNVPGVIPKLSVPKLTKDKSKSRAGVVKGGRSTVVPPPTAGGVNQDETVVNSSAAASSIKEDYKARQSRLSAYDDAIESVLRKVQQTEDDVLYDQIASDFGNEDQPFIPPIIAASKNLDRDERQAQISDTIDAVIARTFHDSDQSPSPPHAPVASPPPYDDEDEIIEVHSVSPLKVEVTTDDVLILPPPSPPVTSSPGPVHTSPERNFTADIELEASTSRRAAKKSKNRQTTSVTCDYDKDDSEWSHSRAKSPSAELSSQLRFGIPDSYVRLEELATSRKSRQVKDIEDEWRDVSQPLSMDAAESLMKLAGVAPPPKRLRISYGLGRERTVEDSRDDSEDHEIYESKMTSASKPGVNTDIISDHDLDQFTASSSAVDLLTLETSSRDERAKNRSRELSRVSADVDDSLCDKPATKKGRARKDNKKRDRAQKAAVITV